MGKLRDAACVLPSGCITSVRVGNALIRSTVLACAASALLCKAVLADVSFDGSLGVDRPLVGPDYQILETDGRLAGTNLFHSFLDFSLHSGESATFSATSDISNVLSRVTGGNVSMIDGAIISTIPGANFFFMNPNGVLFGLNASIDVGGAFTVTTADQLELADSVIFSAQPGAADFSLTSANVASFGFLGPGAPAFVSFEGSQLNTTAGSSFSSFNVIAGDVTLNNAAISTPAGNVSIVSVGSVSDESVGRVHLNATDPAGSVSVSDFTAMGDVSVADSTIETGAFGVASSDRRVLIRGGRLMFERSQVQSYGAIHLQSSSDFAMNYSNVGSELGAIDVDAGNDFTMINGSNIAGGGAIHIDAGNDFTMIGDNVVPNAINSFGGEVIRVEAGETITITDATIVSNATASENGGDIQIYGKNLIIGLDDLSQSTLRSGAIYSLTEGDTEYRSGDITIYMTENIVLNTDAGIVGNTTSRGSGANVNVEAGGNLILVVGAISSLTAGPGNGGNVRVETGGDAELGCCIAVGTTQQALQAGGAGGSPGSITLVIGNDLTVTGSIGAREESHGSPINLPSPDAGLIDINAGGKITIIGSINAQTDWSRNAGGILVSAADSIVVDGQVSAETTGSRNLFANRMSGELISELRDTFGVELVIIDELFVRLRIVDADGNVQELDVQERIRSDGLVELISNGMVLTGNGGELLFVENNGGLQTTTGSDVLQDQRLRSGNGGEITLNAGNRIDIVDGTISTATAGAGNAGGVTLYATDISVGGSVSSESTGTSSDLIPAGRAGTVFFSGSAPDDSFDIANSITISGAVTTSTVDGGTETGEAGSISFIAGSLQISEGGSVTASTSGMGKAGSIDVTAADTIDVSGQGATVSTQSEDEATGAAGSISLNADQITISDGGEVTTATVNGGAGTDETGSISIIAGSLQISEGGSVTASTTGMGTGGDIELGVTGTVSVLDGANISSKTAATGDGGNVRLSAQNILIDGLGEISAASTATENGGKGGSVQLASIDGLTVSNGGKISVSSISSDGGDIDIAVDGAGSIDLSGESMITANAGGAGGNVLVELAGGDLILDADSEITANAVNGMGGNLDLNLAGGNLVLDASTVSANAVNGTGGNLILNIGGGEVALNGSSFAAKSENGDGGRITLNDAAAMQLSAGSAIAADAGGNGGDVSMTLTGGNLVLDASTVSANAVNGTGGNLVLNMGGGEVSLNGSGFGANSENGDGGRITLNEAAAMQLSGDSTIAADAGGNGGNVLLDLASGDLILDTNSAITANGGRDGGNVSAALAGGDLILDANSAITANAGRDGGNVSAALIGGNLTLDTNSAITANGGRDGGVVNVSLRNKGLLWLDGGSSITANAQRDGGNLNVSNIPGDGSGVILNHSSITANAIDGTGGIVNITADFLLANESTIEASSENGADGTVTVNVVFDLGNTEARFSDEVVDEQEVTRGLDPSKVADDHSTFVPGGGRGGIPVDPSGYMPSLKIWDLPHGEPQPLEP